jgi:hypothetical protein
VLSREVVEGKQRVAILDQALDSLVVFDAPGFDEGVERGECNLLAPLLGNGIKHRPKAAIVWSTTFFTPIPRTCRCR